MGKDAEKIIIYISPFVMGMKVDIVMFDIENDKIEFIENDNVTGMLGVIDSKLIYSLVTNQESGSGCIKTYSLVSGENEIVSKTNYTINPDLTYDVYGNIIITYITHSYNIFCCCSCYYIFSCK